MVIVVGVFEVEAEDRERFLAGKLDQVAASRSEPGCIDYTFSADAADPGGVRLLERWESRPDLEAHVAGLRASPSPDGGVPSRMVEVAIYEATPAPPLGG
ncbi:MAG: putative quinol monooxygenase [Acidimicrobiales bacterium]